MKLLLLCFSIFFTTGIHADNWSMARGGPALRGLAVGKIADAYKLAWRFETGDAIKGGAAVVDGRVYTGSLDGHVYALDLATGENVWTFETGGGIESTPLVVDGVVYVGSGDAKMYALAADTGKEKWRFACHDRIAGGVNMFRDAGALRLVFGSYDSNLYCVDADTGEKVWSYESGSYINGTPAVAENRVIAGGCDALVHIIDALTGKAVHMVNVKAYVAGSAGAADGTAYLGHYGNEFISIDLAEGEVGWRFKQRPFPFFASPAVGDDDVVFGGRDKLVHCVDRKTGKERWSFRAQGRVDSSPVICGGRVIAAADGGRLYILNLNDGTEVWGYDIGQPIQSSPAIVDGQIIIGADDGALYAFRPATEEKQQ